MSGSFQVNGINVRWDGDDPPPAGTEPIHLDGGAEDGQTLGTAFCDGEEWTIVLGVDEDGWALPGAWESQVLAGVSAWSYLSVESDGQPDRVSDWHYMGFTPDGQLVRGLQAVT